MPSGAWSRRIVGLDVLTVSAVFGSRLVFGSDWIGGAELSGPRRSRSSDRRCRSRGGEASLLRGQEAWTVRHRSRTWRSSDRRGRRSVLSSSGVHLQATGGVRRRGLEMLRASGSLAPERPGGRCPNPSGGGLRKRGGEGAGDQGARDSRFELRLLVLWNSNTLRLYEPEVLRASGRSR